MSKLLPWREVPSAGWLEEKGNAEEYETGDWRTIKPIWLKEHCIQCLRCFVYCPDSAITAENGRVTGVDYKHCKGCGICAHECPSKPKALEMVAESADEL
ncbi:MAG: 4Fe-4S binding protein [Firmicutes bacterium]|nr:4Fe-4S binding protein [Bacillota bacterium]